MISARKTKTFRLRVDLVAEFKKTSEILGLEEQEAAEIALTEWLKKNQDEAQKRLDLYTQKGVTIKEPGIVNVHTQVLLKAEVLVAKQELKDFLTWFEKISEVNRENQEMEIAQRDARDLLRKVQPVLVKTRDPELAELVQSIGKRLEAAENDCDT
jgi:hypothetical protein